MPTLRQYRVFISHAWAYGGDYYRIEQFLDTAPYFSWKNLSVPQHDPLETTDDLAARLRDQMRNADVVLVLAGMYVAHSDWIDFEIQFARRIGRPIVGVQPWGSAVTPVAVQRAAKVIVGWRQDSIVKAIRDWAL